MAKANRNAYALLLSAASDAPRLNGSVEVLEDPAVQGTATNPVKYQDKEYSHADDIHLGLASGSQGGQVHATLTAVNFQAAPSDPFKPKAMIIPSTHQWQLYVRAIRIGSFNAIDGDDIPAEAHSEVSLSHFVSWPTIQPNQPIIVTMWNQAGWNKRYAIDLRGTRLRA
jgi:hypothetical protein